MRSFVDNATRVIRLENIAVVRHDAMPRLRDWILVAVLTALVVAETIVVVVDMRPDWAFVRLIPAAVALAVLPWRRLFPLAVAMIAFVADAAFELLAAVSDTQYETTGGHDLAGIIALYALCRWATARNVGAGLTVVLATTVVAALVSDDPFLESLAVLIPWGVVLFAALAMRYRAGLVEQQYVQVRLEERHALARELHDAVAHHVSAIAIQAQAAQFVAETDPDAAKEAMRSVEQIATTAIDEMRRMVGILRSDDDQDRSVTPDSLAGLVEAPGSPPVTLQGDAARADLSDLSSTMAAAVFRTAQEAITNARRHSRDATFIDLAVDVRPEEVRVSIVNDGTPTTRNSGSGYGLVGMRERIEALGGSLQAGARPSTGWSVEAAIPRRRGADRLRSAELEAEQP